MKRLPGLLLPVLLLLSAETRASGGGSSGAEFLRVAMGARPAALGENFTGLADDVNAASWNPAGLGQLKNMQFSAMHLKYIEDINFEYLAASMPFGEWGSAAVSGAYMAVPPFDSTDPALNGTAKGSASDAVLALSWGGSFGPLSPDTPEFKDVYYGLSGKMIYRSLGGYSPTGGEGQTFTAVAGAVDLGAFWAYTPALTFGAMVQNIGSTVTFLGDESDALPFAFRAGVAWRGYDEEWLRATVLADAVKPYDPDGGKPGNAWGGVGAEFLIIRMLSLRTGFRMGPEGSSVVGGAGLVIGPVSADYAFTPMSGFDATHRMSLTVKLGAPEPRRLPATAKITAKAMPKKRIDLNWEPVKEAMGYFVEVRKGNGAFKRVTPKPREKTSIPFKGLKAGEKYTFRVIPVDAKGREGRPGEMVLNLKSKARTAGGTAPAGVPARLAAGVEGRQVTLSWEPVAGSSGYHVYYKKAGGPLKKATAAAPRRTTKLLLKGLAPQTYEFSVSAVDAAGKEGTRSAPVPAQVAP